MSQDTTKVECPGCGTGLRLKTASLGKSIRCPRCEHLFRPPVEEEEQPTPRKAPPRTVQEGPPARQKALAARAAERGRDREEDEPRLRKKARTRGKAKKGGFPVLLVVLGAVGLVVLVGCGGIVALFVMARNKVNTLASELATTPGQKTSNSNSKLNLGGPGTDSPDAVSTKEDSDVAEYFKKKGWNPYVDQQVSFGRPLNYLMIYTSKDHPLSNEDCKMIAKSKSIQVLMFQSGINDDALKILASKPDLVGISVVGDEHMTDSGVAALGKCRTLESVSIVDSHVTDEGIKALAALPKLRVLNLQYSRKVQGSAFAAFAGCPALELLLLNDTGLNDEGARHLAALPNLSVLEIESTSVTTAGIRAIVQGRMPPLFKFDAQLIDDELLESLVKKGWLYGPSPPLAKARSETKPATAAEVQNIYLYGSKITDKGLRLLQNCTNVTNLGLSNTKVTDGSIPIISAFKKLKSLDIKNTGITDAGVKQLQTALPGCKIE